MKVRTGLDIIHTQTEISKSIKGNIGYLCHPSSVNVDLVHGIDLMKDTFGKQFTKIFSPQHGLFADVQDNMVESNHFFHSHYKLPVYSLYSETRKPTSDMLEGLEHVVIDLQDVGTRIYTYIYTMTYMMEACAEQGIEVIVLDRPNPIDCETIEGNVLDPYYQSFIGRHPIPMRHGLTMGEVALMATKYWDINCNLRVIQMEGYERSMNYNDTGLPWVLPSPNLPTMDGCYDFPGTVLFEGTNISEGRGTSRGLEIVGHPKIKHFELLEELNVYFKQHNLVGFTLRPMSFIPTFQKHHGIPCHGYQIHVTDYKTFQPWAVGQVLCQKFYHHLGSDFLWKEPPYEYEHILKPIDILNGTDRIRKWIETNGNFDALLAIAEDGMKDYMDQREAILIY